MSLFGPREDKYVWFDEKDYGKDMIVDVVKNSPITEDSGSWQVDITQTKHEWRGLDLSIRITNISEATLPAPKIKINTGMYHATWNGAGTSSYWRHVKNYFNHDSFGMRVKPVTSTANAGNDRFGITNAIYGKNWYAPCLAVDNYVDNSFYGNGQQMVSVSTNYQMPFNIYGDYDASTLQAYFNLVLRVDDGNGNIVGDFESGETRVFTIWLRYETYNHGCSFGTAPQRFGSKTYRKIAALRSYEPYFVDYWSRVGDYNHGPRVGGRIYGVSMSGADAPTSYFDPKDNPRRYYLFRKSDGKNLMGALPRVNEAYINPQNVSGWQEFLDNVCNPTELKMHNYKAVMLFNVAGYGNNDTGNNPSVFRTLPINLRNTFSELKDWESIHGIRVFISAEDALRKVNLGNYFDASFDYEEGNSIHDEEIHATFNEGLLRACSGVAFRNLPDVSIKEYAKNYLLDFRRNFPHISFFSYGRPNNDIVHQVAPVYLDRQEFLTKNYQEGGRDWFLDLITPGADPYVLMSYKSWSNDYGDTVNTQAQYDEYVNKIELDHQAVPITLDRIVRQTSLYPNKLNATDDFDIYASYFIFYQNSICRPGDTVINKQVCRPSLVHQYYSTNSPTVKDMMGLIQQDFYLDYTASPRQSWLPFSGISNDIYSGSGEAALWLYEEDKLQKVVQTVINNLTGVGRGFAYLPAGYDGDVFQNFELRAIRQTALGTVTEKQVSVGFGLEMFETSAPSNNNPLVRSVTGNLSDAKTLRDWWIWVQNQVNPGWSTGKTVEQQSIYLQTEWASRWLYWMRTINATIRDTIPTIGKIGFFGSVPQSGVWAIKGLFFGSIDPDLSNSRRVTELSFWEDWIQEWDFLAPAFYLFKPSVAYNAPYLYINESFVQTPRFEADPIQHRLYHLLSIRDAMDLARIANKPLYVFMEASTTGTAISLPANIADFLIRSMYTAGCQGSIWFAVIQTRQNALDLMQKLRTLWFDAGYFIETRIEQYAFVEDAPSAIDVNNFYIQDVLLSIDPTTYELPGLDAKLSVSQITTNNIANTGRYLVQSQGGTTQLDKIKGFGISRFNTVYSGLVKDKFPEDYANFVILAYANSLDGTFVLNQNLSKYNDLQVTIRNPSFSNVGYPHWVIEDNLEWVNSGMPSHLSQVHAINIITAGVSQEKIAPNTQQLVAPLYQCEITLPKNTTFYDKLNSTIDYILEEESSASNLRLGYVTCAFYHDVEDVIYVGGANGVLIIDNDSKDVTELDLSMFNITTIVDIKKFNNRIYIADRSAIYVYNSVSKNITKLDIATKIRNINTFAFIGGGTLCIGTNEGIYVGLYDNPVFKLAVPTSTPIKKIVAPDMMHAFVADGDAYYSTNGLFWYKYENKIDINNLAKYYTKTYFATNSGLATDNGTVYNQAIRLQYIYELEDGNTADEEVINDVILHDNKIYAAVRDGRYYIFGPKLQEFSTQLPVIHKILSVGSDVYVFGNDKFQILSENIVRRLTTGTILR